MTHITLLLLLLLQQLPSVLLLLLLMLVILIQLLLRLLGKDAGVSEMLVVLMICSSRTYCRLLLLSKVSSIDGCCRAAPGRTPYRATSLPWGSSLQASAAASCCCGSSTASDVRHAPLLLLLLASELCLCLQICLQDLPEVLQG